MRCRQQYGPLGHSQRSSNEVITDVFEAANDVINLFSASGDVESPIEP
jgi:hypothetical protein